MMWEKQLLKLHLSTNKIKLFRKNSMSVKNLNPLLKSIKFKSKKFSNIDKFLKINFDEIKRKWPKKLPSGIIHGDLFIDNIFLKKINYQALLIFILRLMITLCTKLPFVLMLYALIR